jgi:enoyl-CoA hydratase/carnithine racemase
MKLNIIKRYSVSPGRRKYQSPSFRVALGFNRSPPARLRLAGALSLAGALPALDISLSRKVFRWMGDQADAREGVTAFLEKRAPQWPLSKVKDYPPML